MKTFVEFRNIDTKESITISGDTNSMKAMIFDMFLNRDFDYSSIRVDEIATDEEYIVCYKFNKTIATGYHFEMEY